MLLIRIQVQSLIPPFRNLNINQQLQVQDKQPVQIMEISQEKYALTPFEGNIYPKEPQGIKLYLQETREMEKEADKLDVSFLNAKYIIDHFLSLVKKYG